MLENVTSATNRDSGVSRVWQAWLVPWAPPKKGAQKIAWHKLKFVIFVSSIFVLRPIQQLTVQLHQHSDLI